MHQLGNRERNSKVYPTNGQSILMNNDHSHERINESKLEETKHVQEKKQIDRILLGIVKERMFGTFLNEDTRLSVEQHHTLDMIHRNNMYAHSRPRASRSIRTIEFTTTRRPSYSQQLHNTIDLSRQSDTASQNLHNHNKRKASQKLPKLKRDLPQHNDPPKKTQQIFHSKKLQINEKLFAETFRKWATPPTNTTQTIYELKVTRQSILNKTKNTVDTKLLQRFFHFFSFPPTFGLRNFCSLLQNAANCNLRFIDFWVFGLLDQNSNGILTSQDFFQFLQRFSSENFYIEEEVYEIQRYLQQLQRNFLPREGEALLQQMLTMNHNLRLQELKDILKQSGKERIDVNCVKNTCYHQTVMSLEHDPIERIKQNQIENNQLATKQINNQMSQNRKKLQQTPGIRLRDFYLIFKTRRPKIFCFFIQLLTGLRPQDYQ